jgi:nitronate monooxygenase
MGGYAGADLAIAVSKAGGLGHIGAVKNMKELDDSLTKVDKVLDRHDGLLPIGVGVLPFILNIDEAMPVLEKHKPAVIWLFAAKELNDYVTWANRARAASPKSQVWIQIGSVEAALKVAASAHPNAMCVQGIDAGGHGFEKGAGIISLLPEVADALEQAGYGDIRLLASGGITEGRGAAAALTLGAEGVVMGTRFLSAPETMMHPGYRAAVIAASDGGQSTIRCKLFDELRGPNEWPVLYDGRSIVNESFTDHLKGVGIDEIRRLHGEAVKAEGAGFGQDRKGRATVWAGTGVGLVTKVQPAAEIVEEVRAATIKALKAAEHKL